MSSKKELLGKVRSYGTSAGLQFDEVGAARYSKEGGAKIPAELLK
jgi:hypothetical protein